MTTFDWQGCFAPLLDHLATSGLEDWAARLRKQLTWRFEDNPHGDVQRWHKALSQLPELGNTTVDLNQPAITLRADTAEGVSREPLEAALRGLMPWRKGPFDFFGIPIDTEWRSDWKWDRVAPHLANLEGRRVLDVGCGSGYHCWRMLGAGARRVIGIDPGLLFLFQFLSVKRYLADAPVDLLPVRMEDLPAKLETFDTTFSMGVLYHRRSPIDHLLELKDTLRRGGELVLETLVVDGPEGYSLVPEDRYGRCATSGSCRAATPCCAGSTAPAIAMHEWWTLPQPPPKNSGPPTGCAFSHSRTSSTLRTRAKRWKATLDRSGPR